MANLILRTNLANKNFNIEHKVLPLPISDNVVELIISPKPGISIYAKDFNYGYLPKQISSISFDNLGSKVIAQIILKNNLDIKKTQNVSLPISGKTNININKFKLIDKTKLSDNIISQDSSPFNKSIGTDETTYSITSKLDNKILVLSKTVLTTGNYYFNKEPGYNIIGNKDRYNVITNVTKNSRGNVIKKVFNIYYTSPKEISNTNSEDIISFQGNVTAPKSAQKTLVATKKEEYKIYSFIPGRDIGTEGGTKRMVVRGVPGSKFKVIVQDIDKKTYNFKTGVFEAGGGMFEGTIPLSRGNSGYGEYNLGVKVPKSTTAGSITTKFMTDKPIDHKKLVKDLKEKGLDSSAVIGDIFTTKNTITLSSSLTFSLFSTGFTIPYTNEAGTANLIIGPGEYNSTGAEGKFDVTIRAATAQVIRIERQPLHSTEEVYVNWDSGSDKDEALTSAGVVIPNDWRVTDAKEAKYKISAKCEGIGVANSDYPDGYTGIRITGTISGVTFGTGDITVSLDLLNFLTLQAL